MTREIKSVYVVPLDTTFGVMNASNIISPNGRTSYKSVLCERITRTSKSGEMAAIPWLDIHTGSGGVVEVRESDCVISAVERLGEGPF